MSPPLGGEAPEFELEDQFGEGLSLARLRDQAHVVLVFFPFAFSRLCTSELDEIRDHLDEFTDAGVQVAALSCDPMYSLRAYAEAEGYDFPLLSDFWPHGRTALRYGAFDATAGRAIRASFLIDHGGVLRWSLAHPAGRARPLTAYREAIAALPGG